MVHVIKNLPTLAVSLDGNEKNNRFFCSRRDTLKYPHGTLALCSGKVKGCLSFNSSRLVNAFERYTLFGIAQLKLSTVLFSFKEVNNLCSIALNVPCELCDGETTKGSDIEKDNSAKDVYNLELSGKDSLMNSYTENFDTNRPSSFLEETKNSVENGILYLEEMDEKVLSKRILKLSRLNKPKSALAMYKSMIFSGLKPDLHACNSLLSSLLRNEMLDDALKVFNSMKARELTTGHTYSLILKAVADARGCDTATNMFRELISSKNLRENIDIVVYNTMISIFAKANNWDQAQKIWKILHYNGQVGTTVTYCLLICTFVRCGQNELAIDAYSEMIHNGLSPESDTMHAIIGAYSREGKYDSALNVLHCMLDSELKPNARACNAVINSLGKAGKVELAFEIYDLMKSLGHAPDVYTWNSLLNALNRANRYCDAIQLFERIRNIQSVILNVHLYNTVLTSYHRLGLWDKAVQVLWQMEASELTVSTASYNQVIGACEVARRPKVALQVYYRMVRQKHSPDIFTLLSLMRVCIWASLYNEAVEILKSELADESWLVLESLICNIKNSNPWEKIYTGMLIINLTLVLLPLFLWVKLPPAVGTIPTQRIPISLSFFFKKGKSSNRPSNFEKKLIYAIR